MDDSENSAPVQEGRKGWEGREGRKDREGCEGIKSEMIIMSPGFELFDDLDLNAAIICHNDELSLSWLDCLLTDSEVFILFAEINQILLKIYFFPILLTFMYLVALYWKTKL